MSRGGCYQKNQIGCIGFVRFMKKSASITVVLGLVMMVLSGLSPSTADEPGGPEKIGEYSIEAITEDLTENHAFWNGGVLQVEAPELATKLRVDTDYLDDGLGAWGVDKQFITGPDYVEFEDRKASFSNISFNENPTFTWGSSNQIKFLERPMWINVSQEEYGKRLILNVEDGNSSGQEIYVAKDWLWERGVHRPNATHEDGTVLPVNQSADQKGFIIDVHHFSEFYLNPADLTVMSNDGGVMTEHDGDARWYSQVPRLEIDVADKRSDYEVWIEKDWVDMNIPYPGVLNHTWSTDTYLFDPYYVVTLSPSETPTLLEIQPHVKMMPFDFYNDIDQGLNVTIEEKGINITSLQTALNTTILPIIVLNESLVLTAEHAPNGTVQQRYLLNNTDPADEMVGIIAIEDGVATIAMHFTSGLKNGTYIGETSNQTFMNENIKYQNTTFLGFLLGSLFHPCDVTNCPEVEASALGGCTHTDMFTDACPEAWAVATTWWRSSGECDGDPPNVGDECWTMREEGGGRGPIGSYGTAKTSGSHGAPDCDWDPEKPWCGTSIEVTHWSNPGQSCANIGVIAIAGITPYDELYGRSEQAEDTAYCE